MLHRNEAERAVTKWMLSQTYEVEGRKRREKSFKYNSIFTDKSKKIKPAVINQNIDQPKEEV